MRRQCVTFRPLAGLLCSVALGSACQRSSKEPDSPVEAVALEIPTRVDATRWTRARAADLALFALPSADEKSIESFSLLWPPAATWSGVSAPENERFLFALPTQGSDGRQGFFALTLPEDAIAPSLHQTLLQLHNRHLSTLYVAPGSTHSVEDDGGAELLDTVENLQTRGTTNTDEIALQAAFRARRYGNATYELCFPIDRQSTPPTRVQWGQRCRMWTLNENARPVELDSDDPRVSHWLNVSDPTTSAPAFFVDSEGHRWRHIVIPLPTLAGTPHEFPLAMEWPVPGEVLGAPPWDATRLAAEIEDWSAPENDTFDERDALQVAARLVALRRYAAGLRPDTPNWFELEARALQKIARTLRRTHSEWDTWNFLATLVDQLDEAAGRTLPRPSSTLLLFDADDELHEENWRGTGFTLDPRNPPYWEEVEGNWRLSLPTNRGLRQCDTKRCDRMPATNAPAATRGATATTSPQDERYSLHEVAGEIAVWERQGDERRLLPFAGLQRRKEPANAPSRVIASPDNTKLAIIWRGVFLGVWPAPSTAAEAAPSTPSADASAQ